MVWECLRDGFLFNRGIQRVSCRDLAFCGHSGVIDGLVYEKRRKGKKVCLFFFENITGDFSVAHIDSDIELCDTVPGEHTGG